MDNIKRITREINSQLISQNRDINSLIFLTTSQSKAQPTIIANLGIMYVHAKKKVVIVDTDFSTNVFSGAFDLKNERGLSDYLEGEASQNEILQDVSNIGLSVVLAGTVRGQSSGYFINDPRFNSLLKQLIAENDYVFINTPKFVKIHDFQNLFNITRNIVLVVNNTGDSKRNLLKMIDACQEMNGNILGYISAK